MSPLGWALRLRPDGSICRRSFFRSAAAGAGLGLWESLRLRAATMKENNTACILVWLAGGPSQMETWDPKPGKANGGQTKAIATAVSGVRIAEHWPRVASRAEDIAFVRSMTNREGNHQRATYQLHTGRAPTGQLKYPNIGSIVAQELGDLDAELPNFVSVGNTVGPGYLGVQAAPFVLDRVGQLPRNVGVGIAQSRLRRRMKMLRAQDEDLAVFGARSLALDHQDLYGQAMRMVLSPKLKVFDLDDEPEKLRDSYGKSSFGQGLLLARRLVEQGVPFVEVRRGGWDNHADLFKRLPTLAGDVDGALATLISDLKRRGLLESTLVVCMGEFGRTPKINKRGGRDHWPKTFSLLMSGGGVRGGKVIGSTTADGTEVAKRPVRVSDLFQSICHSVKLDPSTEFVTPLGRPVKIVDDGSVVRELFS